jgi:hypothetical protein
VYLMWTGLGEVDDYLIIIIGRSVYPLFLRVYPLLISCFCNSLLFTCEDYSLLFTSLYL